MKTQNVQPNYRKWAERISLALVPLLIVVTAGGLWLPDFYRGNLWASSQWRGNDLITLIVGVPLTVGALWLAQRGSLRARLVWLGMLLYALYGYAFYLFGTAFNEFFLLYAAIFALAALGLIFGLATLDAAAVARRFSPATPVRAITIYMLVWAVFLGGLWSVEAVRFIFTDTLPAVIPISGIHTSVVYAIDLTFMVPGLILGGWWLWQRNPWGYVLALLYNVKGAVYALALVMMGVFGERAGVPDATALLPLWAVFTLASTVACVVLLRNMQTRPADAIARMAQPHLETGG